MNCGTAQVSEKTGQEREKAARNGAREGQNTARVCVLTLGIIEAFSGLLKPRDFILQGYWRREGDVSQPIRKNFSETYDKATSKFRRQSGGRRECESHEFPC